MSVPKCWSFVGVAVLALLAACSDATVAPRLRQQKGVHFDVGNPPPPPITMTGSGGGCLDDGVCPSDSCPLGARFCFSVDGLQATIFRTPPSTEASLEFLSQPNVDVSDGAEVRETPAGLRARGTLTVLFLGNWLTIDMSSMRGSLLATAPPDHRLVQIEADAYFASGQLFPAAFVYEVTLP